MTRKVILNRNNLQKFLRGEIFVSQFADVNDDGFYTGDKPEHREYHTIYQITVEDLAMAMNRFAGDPELDFRDFYNGWYYPLVCNLYKYAGFDKYLKPGTDESDSFQYFVDTEDELRIYLIYPLPFNDHELFMYLFADMEKVFDIMSESAIYGGSTKPLIESKSIDFIQYDFLTIFESDPSRALNIALKEYADVIKNFLLFRKTAGGVKMLTQRQNVHLIRCLDHNGVLRCERPQTQRLFKNVVNRQCLINNVAALEAKYRACMTHDNPVFRYNPKAAEKCLLELVEMQGLSLQTGRYASVLGHIYYYGLTDNGTPDYEKAFKYLSMALLLSYDRGGCLLADMYFKGEGVIRSIPAGLDVLKRINDSQMDRLIMDEDNCYPEVAYRIALYHSNREMKEYDPNMAYRIILIAEFALRKYYYNDVPDILDDPLLPAKIGELAYSLRTELKLPERPSDTGSIEINVADRMYDRLEGLTYAKVRIESCDSGTEGKAGDPNKMLITFVLYDDPDIRRPAGIYFDVNNAYAGVISNLTILVDKSKVKCSMKENEPFMIDEVRKIPDPENPADIGLLLLFKGTNALYLKEHRGLFLTNESEDSMRAIF